MLYMFYRRAGHMLYMFYRRAGHMLYMFYRRAGHMLYPLYRSCMFYRRAGRMFYMFYRFLPLSRYDASAVMGEEIIERTVQLIRRSFVLTIPQAIAKEAGIRKGQGVRFRVRDGEIVMSPTGIPGDGMFGSAGPDKYARAMRR